MIRKYILRVLIAYDQFINALLGGYPNETLSSRAWRKGHIEDDPNWDKFRKMIDYTIDPYESNHCQSSYVHFMKSYKNNDGIYYTTHRDVDKPTIRYITADDEKRLSNRLNADYILESLRTTGM